MEIASRAISDANRRLAGKPVIRKSTQQLQQEYEKRLANASRCRWPWPSLKQIGDEVLLKFPEDKDPLTWMESVSSLARTYAKLRGFKVRTNKVRDGLRVIRKT